MAEEQAPTSAQFDLHSLATIRFWAERETISMPATGFLIRDGLDYYLLTALHVLTGRHWETKALLSPTGFIPETYRLMFPVKTLMHPRGHLISWHEFKIEPFADSEEISPWLVHPTLRENVDVAVLPLKDLPERFIQEFRKSGQADHDSSVYAVDWTHQPQVTTRVGDDVFVVGFPENIELGGGNFPIWKRGSLATEPDSPVKGLPMVLVDTGTRAGMSGSPVLRRVPAGLVPVATGLEARSEATCELFGVYSGRYGADELTSQLGIVWKREVIEQILRNPTFGKSSLRPWLW